MAKRTILTILIFILVVLIIIVSVALMLNQFDERVQSDCEKQNNQGIKSYWNMDIDCSNYFIHHDTINGSSGSD